MGEMTGQDASSLLASEVDALMEMVRDARRKERTDKRIIAAIIGGYQLSVLMDGHEGTGQLMAGLVLRLEQRELELRKAQAAREDAAETEGKLRAELDEWRGDMRRTDDLATQRGRALADSTQKLSRAWLDLADMRRLLADARTLLAQAKAPDEGKAGWLERFLGWDERADRRLMAARGEVTEHTQLAELEEQLRMVREERDEANDAATRWRNTAERDLTANENLRKQLAELTDTTVPRSRYTAAATELAAQVRRFEEAKRELAQVMEARDNWRSQAEHYKAEALRMGAKALES
jgi:hypothetical protein